MQPNQLQTMEPHRSANCRADLFTYFLLGQLGQEVNYGEEYIVYQYFVCSVFLNVV